MRLIITAGGTTERIDRVRKIKNTGTGKLGSLTAEAFVKLCGDRIEKIYYVCEKGTIVPQLDCLEEVNIEGVLSAEDTLTRILTADKIDAVVHSMAVSDYTVDRLTTTVDLAEFIAHRLADCIQSDFRDEYALADFIEKCIEANNKLINRDKKVGSNIKDLAIFMKQTPKLISLFKPMQPDVVLVGFKLLNNVERENLLAVAMELMQKNSCDFVLANDSSEITADAHIGYLLASNATYTRLETKEQIADEIARNVIALLDKRS